jgi:hypothetical protein
MFRKPDLFPSSGEGKETPTLLGPIERTNLNQVQNLVILSVIHHRQNPLEYKNL